MEHIHACALPIWQYRHSIICNKVDRLGSPSKPHFIVMFCQPSHWLWQLATVEDIWLQVQKRVHKAYSNEVGKASHLEPCLSTGQMAPPMNSLPPGRPPHLGPFIAAQVPGNFPPTHPMSAVPRGTPPMQTPLGSPGMAGQLLIT